MVLGIALGVAVVVAIDLANASAGRAFELSTEALTGKATHQINGGPQGLDEQVYVDLKRGGLERTGRARAERVRFIGRSWAASPCSCWGSTRLPTRLSGSFLGEQDSAPLAELTAFLTRPGAVLLSRPTGGALWAASRADALTSTVQWAQSAGVCGRAAGAGGRPVSRRRWKACCWRISPPRRN